MVRYDTRKPCDQAASYELLDLAKVSPEPCGMCGGVVVSSRLVLTPSDDAVHICAISIALLYDTALPLGDTSAWKAVDLKKVHPRAAGYQAGWLDTDGLVWFVPDNNLLHRVPPLITWNSRLPFHLPGSWKAYETKSILPSTGAAYDPNTNRAWLAPYGGWTKFSIKQVQIQ